MNQQTLVLHTQQSIDIISEENDPIMQQISKSILTLGFKPKLKGYIYVKDAIYFYIINPQADISIGDIYAKIAQKHDITTTSVERAIRNLIIAAWYNDGINKQHELFQYSYLQSAYHPSNAEFIATIAELIRLEMKESF